MKWKPMAMILIGWLALPMAALAEAGAAATLTVLSAPVERHGGGGAGTAVNGMSLAEGDRIKTGAGGLALVTFLDGSTVTVLSDSEVTVKQAPMTSGKSGIRMLIQAGRVWARVVQAAGRRGGLSLESNEYTATAHDGLIGAERGADGFVCWTRKGFLRLTGRGGQVNTVLMPGQRAWLRFGLPANPEPFVASASTIEIRSSGPALPLLRMPDGGLVAGFLAGGVEVNQVFGSLTDGGGQRWLVEVPAGHKGPYTLVLTGAASGSFTVKVFARYAGMSVYRQEIKGTISQGEQLFTHITPDVRGEDPRTARVLGASLGHLSAWDSAAPAAVVTSPAETRHPDVN